MDHDPLCSRRSLLTSGLRLSGALAASTLAAGALAEPATALPTELPRAPATPAAALKRLMNGNARFVRGRVRNPRRDSVRRVELASGQKPYAAVLTCADSRVPPEIVFDEGLGDIFTVRIAGNTATDPLVIGSLEYAVTQLGSIAIFVLGHGQCGAVKAAIDVVTTGATLPGNLGDFVAPIVPAVEAVKTTPKDQLLEAATENNVRRTILQLNAVPLIRDLVTKGSLVVAGGEYELETGEVQLLS